MKKQIYRAVKYPNGFWVHNGRGGILDRNKFEAAKELNKLYPGDYELIEVNIEEDKERKSHPDSQN
jgi:hypothetical protein